MKTVRWNPLKSRRLKRTRGVSFEELMFARLVAVKQHPSRAQQRLMLFEHAGYIWVVPFVETEQELFLKTLFPSRKYTALYRKGELR